jgi:ubiquinone/menaquinone biosynthesis C-methylase UbiE
VTGLDRIQLFSPDYMSVYQDTLAYIEEAKTRLGKNLGWHYFLDLIWILQEIKSLPKGSVILDAGAGHGLLQFLLQEQGYHVISVDFVDRPLSRLMTEQYHAVTARSQQVIDNEYVRHLKENYQVTNDREERQAFEGHIHEWLGEQARIVFYRADLKQLDLVADRTVDCIVSVSALEHNDHEDIKQVMSELDRVLKPDGRMLITVSGTEQAQDWFHEQSKGWCFTEASLIETFGLSPDTTSNYSEAAQLMEQLKACTALAERLAPFYFQSANNGMPWGVWDPKYLPLGLIKHKQGESGHV